MMKKVLKISLFAFIAGLYIDVAFAAHQQIFDTLPLAYQYADPKNCPADLVVSLHKKPLILVFGRKMGAVKLMGTNTINTSISPRIIMGAEGLDDFYAYMSTDKTTLTIDSVAYKLQQLWIQAPKDNPDNWMSAFYLGDNKECLVANSLIVLKDSLADPHFKK